MLKTRFFAAAFLFVAISALAQNVRIGGLSPADVPFDTWTSAAVKDLISTSTGRPNVVLVGSSLMLAPLGGVDSDLLNAYVDGPHYHRSQYLERAYQRATGDKIRTFNFALPGEMPSDAWMITKFLLKGDKRPNVLVYGLGPRDFLDNILPSPSATDPYQTLSRFGDTNSKFDLIYPDWQSRLNAELSRANYFYRQKVDLTTSFDRAVTALMAQVAPSPKAPITLNRRREILPDYRVTEVGVHDCLFGPTANKPRAPFLDNISEYRRRYKKLKWDTYLSQMNFLADLMNIARQRDVHVVIMAMPITDINRRLISDQAWDLYRQSIKVMAQAKGASYIDMEGSGAFKFEDFGDTVHLHSGGGAKLLSLLSQKLAQDKSVALALKKPLSPELQATTVAGLRGASL